MSTATKTSSAYEEAKRRIAHAMAEGATTLDLSIDELSAIPAEIAEFASLRTLIIWGAPVTDLTYISELKSLQILDLKETLVTDLSPLHSLPDLKSLDLRNTRVDDLVPLTRHNFLASLLLDNTAVTDLRPIRDLGTLNPIRLAGYFGLHFANTSATHLDPELARLSRIEDDHIRTRDTLAYLNALDDAAYDRLLADGPPDQPLPRQRPDTARAIARAMTPSLRHLSLADVQKALDTSYPDLRDRAQYVMSLILEEEAVHRLIPTPNDKGTLEDYQRKENFLATMRLSVQAFYAALPDHAGETVPDARCKKIKDRLVNLAQKIDAAIDFLDNHEGSYGSLYKIGLISSVAGLLCLFPGVTFAPAALISGGVIGATTVKLKVSNGK
ncbi:leucine rich repeats (2 copies) [mine drainage metagenome]|uniref:Leucine rich repeats (2 copies) n=1 Tax=mine drainage metagenome TaxID=410659 RepID=A0A1J5PU59_9ZZZZ